MVISSCYEKNSLCTKMAYAKCVGINLDWVKDSRVRVMEPKK